MSRILQGREARMERGGRVSAQADKPFEHEARLKELLLRQAELDAGLDLDKTKPRLCRGESRTAGG